MVEIFFAILFSLVLVSPALAFGIFAICLMGGNNE